MYKCYDCESVFTHPKEVRENMGECWGSPAYEFFTVCPVCGSEDFDEVDEWEDDEDEEDEDDDLD